MAYDQALAERIADHFTAQRVVVESKSMMGGVCFMVGGKMCVGVVKSRLMLRLDPAMEAAALRQPGCGPMDFTGRPMKGYVFVQPEGCESDSQLRSLLNLALEFNPRAQSSRKGLK